MLQAIPAHIKFVIGHNILGIVIFYSIICSEFMPDRFLRGKQIDHLNIELLPLLFGNKINCFFSCFANGNFLAPAQPLHKTNILKNEIDIFPIPAENSVPDSVVSNVVFFIDSEDFLPLQILSADTVE